MRITFDGPLTTIIAEMMDFAEIMGNETQNADQLALPLEEKEGVKEEKRRPGRPKKTEVDLPIPPKAAKAEVIPEEKELDSGPITKESLMILMQKVMEKPNQDKTSAITKIREIFKSFDATGLSMSSPSSKPLDPKLYPEFKKAMEKELSL